MELGFYLSISKSIVTKDVINQGKVLNPTFDTSLIGDLVKYLEEEPLYPPYWNDFGELARRTRFLGDLVASADDSQITWQKEALLDAVDSSAALLYPFLPQEPTARPSLSGLRSSTQLKSPGFVIPTGNEDVRFAAHLIISLRDVLKSELPIQIAYAGDGHLSPESRQLLGKVTARGTQGLDFLDLLSIFDDSALRLQESKNAVRSFAVLASKFEKVILVDPDTVFLQKPEVLFEQPALHKSRAVLFRDQRYPQRISAEYHQSWSAQVTHANSASNTSQNSAQRSQGWEMRLPLLQKRAVSMC